MASNLFPGWHKKEPHDEKVLGWVNRQIGGIKYDRLTQIPKELLCQMLIPLWHFADVFEQQANRAEASREELWEMFKEYADKQKEDA